jgi:hypothetical protein
MEGSFSETPISGRKHKEFGIPDKKIERVGAISAAPCMEAVIVLSPSQTNHEL